MVQKCRIRSLFNTDKLFISALKKLKR